MDVKVKWSVGEIADAVEWGLRGRAAADDLEQAVYGFDALDELGLHPVVCAGLRGVDSESGESGRDESRSVRLERAEVRDAGGADIKSMGQKGRDRVGSGRAEKSGEGGAGLGRAGENGEGGAAFNCAGARGGGWGVLREVRYPGDAMKTRRTEGKRCDVVLTPLGDDGEALEMRDPLVRGTLFDDQPACDAEDVYWLEIKTVAQFETSGPFGRYASELLQPVTGDVKKIWGDPKIRFGGLLLVLFTQNRETAEHDILTWHERCVSKGYPVGAPAVRGFAITDRIGNGWCAAAVFGVRGA